MNRKGFAPIIIVLIVAVILVAGGFWYWQEHTVNQNPQPAQNVPNSQAASTTSVDTSNWVTFANDNVQFQYPSTWVVTSTDHDVSGYELSLSDADPNGQWYGDISFYLKSYVTPNNLSDYAVNGDYGKSTYNDPDLATTVSSWQSTTINGHTAIQFDTEETGSGRFHGQNLYGSNIFINFNDYIVATHLIGTGPNIANVIHQIYQSFQLKNGAAPQPTASSSLDVSTWKTIDTGVISLNYPSNWNLTAGKQITQNFQIQDASLTQPIFHQIAISVMSQSNVTLLGASDYNQFFTASNGQYITSQSNTTINGFPAKTYELREPFAQETTIVLSTKNYVYVFTLSPGVSDPYLSKIIGTIKIEKQ